MKLLLFYISVMWLATFMMTCYDKIAAVKDLRRVSEKSLLLVGLCGGALPMYCTMLLINHKTRHAKFMILLPLEVLLHIGIVLGSFWLRGRIIG